MRQAKSLEPISAALYGRDFGLEDRGPLHREKLRAAARARNVTVVLEVDDVEGADCPGLVRVLEAASTGRVAVVFVLRLDHLGNSASEALEAIRALRDVRCQLVVVSQELEIPAEGEISDALVAMLSAVGDMDHEVARRRARRGAANARRVGKRLGRKPTGTAPDGACVRDLRQQGCTWGQIARRLCCTKTAARRAFDRTS